MQTRRVDSFDILEQKTSQLDISELKGQSDTTGYLFFCSLCDEALVLSRGQINPRRIHFAFTDNCCPGCGFELDKVLDCKISNLPTGKRLLTNLKCKDPSLLLEPAIVEEDYFQTSTGKGSFLPRDEIAHLTSGISSVDNLLVLKRGQFISFLGEQAHSFSLQYLVRAMLPHPQGLHSDIVVIDGGNIFETYTVSQHAACYELETDRVQEKIHLSRAFTHHQLYNLMVEKLPEAIDAYDAKLAIVTDISLLFSDPDVRDKKEAQDLFNKSLRHIGMIAEQKKTIIIVTNLQTRNRTMDAMLTRIPHVSVKLIDHGAYTRLVLARHPFLPQKIEKVTTLENQTLRGYLS